MRWLFEFVDFPHPSTLRHLYVEPENFILMLDTNHAMNEVSKVFGEPNTARNLEWFSFEYSFLCIERRTCVKWDLWISAKCYFSSILRSLFGNILCHTLYILYSLQSVSIESMHIVVIIIHGECDQQPFPGGIFTIWQITHIEKGQMREEKSSYSLKTNFTSFIILFICKINVFEWIE